MLVFQTRLAIAMTFIFTCLMTTTVFAQVQKPDYIGGPWLYTAIPCEETPCDEVQALEIDFLSQFTGKLADENALASGQAKPKEILFLGGRLTWHAGFLSGRGLIFTDNIGALVDEVELNPAGYANAVFYGLIVLNAEKALNATMHLGYSAVAKIWLNGDIVYESKEWMWADAENMSQRFFVPLKRGKNLLMAKVGEGIGWNLFVGINANFRISYQIKSGKIIPDDSLPVKPVASNVSTRWASLKMKK